MKLNIPPSLQLAIASSIFGLGAVLVIFIRLDAVVIAFYRMLLGGFFFGLILLYKRQSFRLAWRGLFFASLAGMMFSIDLALWNQSIIIIGPGIATILNSLQIFFMAAFGVILFGNRLTKILWGSLLVSFLGVILLSSEEVLQKTNGGQGVIVGVASALAFALSMLALREAARYQKNSIFNTMFYSSISGCLIAAIWGIWTGKEFFTEDPSIWGIMLFYGGIVHVFAWSLMAVSMPHLSVAIVGLIFCLEPVVALMADVVFLNKTLSYLQVLGAILTIGAVYLGAKNNRDK